MIFEWLNAREVVAVGTSLADSFALNELPTRVHSHADHVGSAGTDIQRLLNLAAQEVRPLNLNVFKRAKLLGSFKWRLQERGLDSRSADELTHLLLLQLTGGSAFEMGVRGGGALQRTTTDSKRRIPALLAEADALFSKGEFRRAADRLQQALVMDSNHAFARNKLGAAFTQLGRYPEAEREFRRAIAADPNFVHAQFNLGVIHFWKGEFDAAETAQRRAIKLDPKNPEFHVALAMTLGTVGKLSDARTVMESALRMQSHHAGAIYGMGWLEAMEGHHEKAELLYRRALEKDSRRVEAWSGLADLRRMTLADSEWCEGVKNLIAAGVTPREESSLRFALGKYFDDLEKYSSAFEEYKRANDLQKLMVKPYDRPAREAFVDDMVRAYSRDRLMRPLEGADNSERPVFVIGMMRSGTSLMEQIIASHPRAAGAGELDYWNFVVHKQRSELQRVPPNARTARDLVAGYLRVLERYAGDAARVVDKSTMNSDLVGMIHLLLPRARFIYLNRDPADTCLSCYFQNFVNAAAFTMDLKDLAHYYRGHQRLVSHWRSVLPSDAFLEVPYAELVSDQEGWSRRIIEFIGLEWDPRVLEFEKTERAVLTASNWQVRQKMYSSSVGRSKHYQKYIGPLLPLRKLSP